MSNVRQILHIVGRRIMYYENYEQIRDKKGLNDYQTSLLARVSRSTISEWKTGKHTPNVNNLKKIAAALGVSINALTKGGK